MYVLVCIIYVSKVYVVCRWIIGRQRGVLSLELLPTENFQVFT